MSDRFLTIRVENEPIDVCAFYRRHGWAALPPTPTMTGQQIKAEAPTPWDPNYQLGRIEHDESVTIIGDGEAIPLTDGQRFIGIPSGTIGGMHG
jgi:hypothetical protein